MRHLPSLTLGVLCLGFSARAETIGAEASVAVPGITTNSSVINWRPASGSVQTLNPPIFMWPYNTNDIVGMSDEKRRTFRLQVSFTNFGAMVVDKATDWNFWNALAPFTNGTSPIYFRVVYLTNGVTEYTSPVRNFTVASSPTFWDRTLFDSDTYLTNRGHPHMLFNSTNRAAVSTWLDSNITYGGFNHHTYVWMDASNNMEHIGWTQVVQNVVWDMGTWVQRIEPVAFFWALRREPYYTNGFRGVTLAEAINRAATNWLIGTYSTGVGFSMQDYYGLQDCAQSFGHIYDWAYDILNETQRANIRACVDVAIEYTRTNSWRDHLATAVDRGSMYKQGAAHPMATIYLHFPMYFATAQESTNSLYCLKRMLNFMASKSYQYSVNGGGNQGRVYTEAGMGNTTGYWLESNLGVHINYPELGITNAPWLQNFLEWFPRICPVGLDKLQEPYGDAGYGIYPTLGTYRMGRTMAQLSQRPDSAATFLNQSNWNKTILGSDPWSNKDRLGWYTSLYHSSIPAPQTNAATSYYLAADGWIVSSKGSGHSGQGFTNGTGYIMVTRTAGAELNHGYPNDANLEMWGWGAMLTSSGNQLLGPGKVGWTHYVISPNGLGQAAPQIQPLDDVLGRIIAYTNASIGTYAAIEYARAYCRSNFAVVAALYSAGNDYTIYNDPVGGHGRAEHIKKVERHVLHPRGKYFVVFDKLETTGTNITWSFNWPVLAADRAQPATNSITLAANEYLLPYRYNNGPHLALATNAGLISGRIGVSNFFRTGPASFYFNSTNRAGQTVKCIVASMYQTNNLRMGLMVGTNVWTNPFSGENYWRDTGAMDGRPTPDTFLWLSNSVPASNWSFLTVIFPVKPGDSDPIILRLSDYSVAITNGAGTEGEVITWDPAAANALGMTVTVNSSDTPDTTAPVIVSAAVNGTTWTITFSESVTFGAGGNSGFATSMSGGASTLTYSSGSGSAVLIYTGSRSVACGETGTLGYTQPGSGIEDSAGNDLATFSGTTVTVNTGCPPGVPTGLATIAGNATVAVSWNTVASATTYILKRTTTSGSGYTSLVNQSGLTYQDNAVVNGTTYYYVVCATNSFGASAFSAEASATPVGGSTNDGVRFRNLNLRAEYKTNFNGPVWRYATNFVVSVPESREIYFRLGGERVPGFTRPGLSRVLSPGKAKVEAVSKTLEKTAGSKVGKAEKPLHPFWIGESTNRPEQSLEKDIRDLRRRNREMRALPPMP